MLRLWGRTYFVRLLIRVVFFGFVVLWLWLNENYLHANETVSMLVMGLLFAGVVIAPYAYFWLWPRR